MKYYRRDFSEDQFIDLNIHPQDKKREYPLLWNKNEFVSLNRFSSEFYIIRSLFSIFSVYLRDFK